MAKFTNIEGTAIFNIPEHEKEITKEYINNVLQNVKLTEHYCVIGLVYVGSLTELISVKANKFSVIPILCKYNSDKLTDDDIMKTVIMDRTDIERGQHLYGIKNELGLASIKSFIINNNLNKAAIGVKAVAIEFKIVPVNDIRGIIGDKFITKSIFKQVISNGDILANQN